MKEIVSIIALIITLVSNIMTNTQNKENILISNINEIEEPISVCASIPEGEPTKQWFSNNENLKFNPFPLRFFWSK